MVYINECIDVNTALKKFLQIYELFVKDPTVSKEFPRLASPRLYLVIVSHLWLECALHVSVHAVSHSTIDI